MRIQINRDSILTLISRTTKVIPLFYFYYPSYPSYPSRLTLLPGRTRLERLIFIGIWSSFLGVDALKAAVVEAKKGRDVRRYIEAQGHLLNVGPGEKEALKDQEWIEKMERENSAETQRLEAELKGYKNNLIKESIRVSSIFFGCGC